MSASSQHHLLFALGGHGGSSIACLELASALARAGHDATLLSVVPIERESSTDGSRGRFERVALSQSFPLEPRSVARVRDRLERAVRRAHRRRTLDLIQVHYLRPLLHWMVGVSAASVAPIAAVAHGTDLTRASLEECDRLRSLRSAVRYWIAPSRALTGEVANKVQPRDQQTIRNGVNLNTFRPAGATQRETSLVQTTNFQPWKRPRLAVEAFGALLERWPNATTPPTLEMIGSGPLLDDCQRHARQLGVDRRITWRPAHPTSAHSYQKHHTYLSTSLLESFGLAALEALACGLEVVGVHTDGLADTVGEAGSLLGESDPEALADLLLHTLTTEPDVERASRQARRFDIDDVVEEWAALTEPSTTLTPMMDGETMRSRAHS